MDIQPIRSEADLSKAIATIEELWGAEPGTPEGNALDVLITLVDRYEDEHFPISAAHPIDVIKIHMEMTGKTQGDLATLMGSASRASEVLNRRRALTVEMVDKLHEGWGIPAEALIKPYQLERKAPQRVRVRASRALPTRDFGRVKKRA